MPFARSANAGEFRGKTQDLKIIEKAPPPGGNFLLRDKDLPDRGGLAATADCGIDLHANNSVLAVVDEHGKLLFNKQLPNDLARILAAPGLFAERLDSVVVESTFNWDIRGQTNNLPRLRIPAIVTLPCLNHRAIFSSYY